VDARARLRYPVTVYYFSCQSFYEIDIAEWEAALYLTDAFAISRLPLPASSSPNGTCAREHVWGQSLCTLAQVRMQDVCMRTLEIASAFCTCDF